MDYWKTKDANIRHAKEIVRIAETKYKKEAEDAAQRAVLYPEIEALPDPQPKPYGETQIQTGRCTTVDAAFQLAAARPGERICLLDFASYKTPGGMFLEGSLAQEESICHESLLYPALASERAMGMFYGPHKKMLNRALYHSDLLYMPQVPFFGRGTDGIAAHSDLLYMPQVPFFGRGTDGIAASFDVIVCAAPNKKAAQRYQGVPDAEVERAMRHRIESVLHAAWDQGAEVLVLGAFGCGVFGNSLGYVSSQFASLLHGKYNGCFKKAAFAVPDKESFLTMKGILGG